MALIVPGFISLRVYDMQRGGEGRKVNDALIDIVVYSFVTDLIALGTLALVSVLTPVAVQPTVKVFAATAILVAIPGVLAVAVYKVYIGLIHTGALPDIMTTPWNRMIEHVAENQLDIGVILTMRDGRTIGAGLASSVALRSESDDLLLGEVWTLSADRATFDHVSPGSYALLVKRSDCETIEFVRLRNGGTEPSIHLCEDR